MDGCPNTIERFVKELALDVHLNDIRDHLEKYAEGNLDRIREAVLDGARAYGLAAVWEFKKSNLYPTEQEMMQSLRATGSHLQVLLEKFKLWLNQSSRKRFPLNIEVRCSHFMDHCWSCLTYRQSIAGERRGKHTSFYNFQSMPSSTLKTIIRKFSFI